MANKNPFNRIVDWNNERGIIDKGYDHVNETSFIIEELLEGTCDVESKKANKIAKGLAKVLNLFKVDMAKEKMVDAFCDIIVFATGAIAKLGYDPNKAMNETLKEIEDRTGKMIDGKFVKDKKENAYKADYSKCLLKD